MTDHQGKKDRHVVAVMCLRNEGAFLLDWLAHHKAVGISHLVALSNDCLDGTDEMLDRLEALGHVTHIRNDGPYDRGGIQFTGLRLADESEAVREADWLLSMDIDEYVNIHVGGRRIHDLLGALPDADAITLTWRMFGNAGVVRYEDRPVTGQFTRAAPEVIYGPWRAAMFKTLYRNDGRDGALGVHRPREAADQTRWFDGSGRALGAGFGSRRVYSDYGQPLYGLAQMNHYALGAMESYLLKADRGRVNVRQTAPLGLDYWALRNFCDVEERSVLALPGVAEIRAELAQDAVLANLHERAVTWRRARFEELMLQEKYRILFTGLLMSGPSRALTEPAGRFLTAFAREQEARKEGAGIQVR